MNLLRRREAHSSEHGADNEPGLGGSCVPISEAVARQRVRVSGQIVRMRARPSTGVPALAVTISDDSGSVTAVWTGRRSIGGITLGRRLIIEGVGCSVGDRLEFTNPTYTLLP